MNANSPVILIVEDDNTAQFVYQKLCQKFNYSANFCTTGEQALDALESTEYAVVLVDYHLPGIDGAEVVRRLRKRESGTGRRTPVVALTASVADADQEILLAAGVDEFMTKPTSIDSFKGMLSRQIHS